MIVQPNFPEHWKTRLLMEITKDDSAPMAVIRLWAHCQHSKRWQFPDMTPAQLASICLWGGRKPACHLALTKAGFVDKLTPKGFSAHQWEEHNAQLIQKWHAGAKGGRPQKAENTNEWATDGKPTDNRPITGQVPDRPDQTRPDQIEQIDQNNPDASQPPWTAGRLPRMDSINAESGIGRNGLERVVATIADQKRVLPFAAPPLAQIRNCLKMHFKGAERYAEAFIKAMNKQHWRDRKGIPITSWQSLAKVYASTCALNQSNANHL